MLFVFFKEMTCSCAATGNTVGKIFEFYKTAALCSLTFFFLLGLNSNLFQS